MSSGLSEKQFQLSAFYWKEYNMFYWKLKGFRKVKIVPTENLRPLSINSTTNLQRKLSSFVELSTKVILLSYHFCPFLCNCTKKQHFCYKNLKIRAARKPANPCHAASLSLNPCSWHLVLSLLLLLLLPLNNIIFFQILRRLPSLGVLIIHK